MEYCFCLVAKLYPTLCNFMDCSLPDSSVLVIFQARILEEVVTSFSRGSSKPIGIEPKSLVLAGRFFIAEPPQKPI